MALYTWIHNDWPPPWTVQVVKEKQEGHLRGGHSKYNTNNSIQDLFHNW